MSRFPVTEAQPIDRLEEKVLQLVALIDTLRAERAQGAESGVKQAVGHALANDSLVGHRGGYRCHRRVVVHEHGHDALHPVERAVDDPDGQLARAIGQKIMKTLDKYARENGYALVIDYSGEQNANIVWSGQGVDITAPVGFPGEHTKTSCVRCHTSSGTRSQSMAKLRCGSLGA